MTKTEGGQVLRDVQGIVHNRSDESVPELISELRAYLAQFPGDVPVIDEPSEPEPDKEPARSARRGRDRRERGGRNRGE